MRIFECVCVAHPKQQSTAVGGGEKAPRAFPSSARTLCGCGCSYSNRRCLLLPSFDCKLICKSCCARSLRRRRDSGQAVSAVVWRVGSSAYTGAEIEVALAWNVARGVAQLLYP